jgi:hypothetical protein
MIVYDNSSFDRKMIENKTLSLIVSILPIKKIKRLRS